MGIFAHTTLSRCSIFFLLLAPLVIDAAFWTSTRPPTSRICRQTTIIVSAASDRTMDTNEIKEQLTKYLQVRKERNADEEAKRQKGTVVGGTQGNKILEYISGAPVKARVIEDVPNIFDYDELTKYGFGNLVTPIMDMGGRPAAYQLMDIPAPPSKPSEPPPPPLKLVIDRKGESDAGRYKGLTLLNDDDALGEALARAQRGERLRPKIEEESYVQPFADKRNIAPKQTPIWTPEKLDEYGRARGRAQEWSRRARMGEFVQDVNESPLELSLSLRLYCISTALLISAAFGRSTPTLLAQIDAVDNTTFLQAPASVLALASIGSSIVSATILAPEKKRNSAVWAFKGLLGGPVSILQLRELDTLVTRGEQGQK